MGGWGIGRKTGEVVSPEIIATHVEDVPPEEMAKRAQQAFGG